ncbi:metabotropic glutamate receptor 1-like [Branchiostoma floridae x Branchiostoma japonicum]
MFPGMAESSWVQFLRWAIFTWIVVWTETVAGRDRQVARMEGDLIIGALFSIHEKPRGPAGISARECGDIREQYGIQRVEAMFQTLDRINSDPTILPNITLGCEIRDSCWHDTVALEQTIEFVRHTISTQTQHSSAQKCPDGTVLSSPVYEQPIVGLIGPGSSSVTIQVQNLLQLFNIPQIAYSATSKDLSDKARYKYFLRVIPPDTLQAQAMADIVMHYNWTYVSTLHTTGNYGQSGADVFKALVKKEGVCIATSDQVEYDADNDRYDNVVRNLQSTPSAHVVVCFCQGNTVRGLLAAMERLNTTGQFLLLGSDGWADRKELTAVNPREAAGSITIKPWSPQVESFDEYYQNLNPWNNARNPWFQEFWQWKFDCRIVGHAMEKTFGDICTGNESLHNYVQDTKLGFVINAIEAMAHGLHDMQSSLCGDYVGLCPQMRNVNGTLLLDHILSTTFLGVNNGTVMFDKNGDPPGRYDIMNFQHFGTGDFGYVKIGSWKYGQLSVDDDIFRSNFNMSGIMRSVCSEECEPLEVKKVKGHDTCCWVCTTCKDDEFREDEQTCTPCEEGWWPRDDKTGCFKIPVEYTKWTDVQTIVAVVFSCVGIMATTFVTTVFVRHRDTPVVKSSSRELCYIILIGLYSSYLSAFPLLAKPDQVTCYLQRICVGLSFSMCYSALVTKTNRIARILAGSKKKIITRKPRFMSATAQVMISFALIFLEGISIAITVVLYPPSAEAYSPKPGQLRLICSVNTFTMIVPLSLDMVLIIMCTYYAFKTRNIPENFNEAKFIGFTMYTTCIIWLAFVPLYVSSDFKTITTCIATSLSATATLGCMFLPKVYIILMKPERNQRSNFTTSNEVRCHVLDSQPSSLQGDKNNITSKALSAEKGEGARKFAAVGRAVMLGQSNRSRKRQETIRRVQVLRELRKAEEENKIRFGSRLDPMTADNPFYNQRASICEASFTVPPGFPSQDFDKKRASICGESIAVGHWKKALDKLEKKKTETNGGIPIICITPDEDDGTSKGETFESDLSLLVSDISTQDIQIHSMESLPEEKDINSYDCLSTEKPQDSNHTSERISINQQEVEHQTITNKKTETSRHPHKKTPKSHSLPDIFPFNQKRLSIGSDTKGNLKTFLSTNMLSSLSRESSPRSVADGSPIDRFLRGQEVRDAELTPLQEDSHESSHPYNRMGKKSKRYGSEDALPILRSRCRSIGEKFKPGRPREQRSKSDDTGPYQSERSPLLSQSIALSLRSIGRNDCAPSEGLQSSEDNRIRPLDVKGLCHGTGVAEDQV